MAIKIKLSQKAQQTIAAVVLMTGALGYGYAAYFWAPISRQIASSRKNLQDMDGKIQNATREAERKPRLDAELAQLNQQAAEAAKRLPKEEDVTSILVTVSQIARQYNVRLNSFSPGRQFSKPFFIEIDFPISVSGDYNSVGRFLAALALQERIFNVANVTYGSPSPTGGLPVNFTLMAYQYKG